jgi:hypothetical protein
MHCLAQIQQVLRLLTRDERQVISSWLAGYMKEEWSWKCSHPAPNISISGRRC